MKLSVIITTYNSEEWLQKVLVGYSVQTEPNFEVVIADDGSTEKESIRIFDDLKKIGFQTKDMTITARKVTYTFKKIDFKII